LCSFIKWNFTKFLIDRNGQPIKRWAPTDNPNVSFGKNVSCKPPNAQLPLQSCEKDIAAALGVAVK
jgi:hypothetical protein